MIRDCTASFNLGCEELRVKTRMLPLCPSAPLANLYVRRRVHKRTHTHTHTRTYAHIYTHTESTDVVLMGASGSVNTINGPPPTLLL